MIPGGSSGRFPEAYLGDFDGELDFITYEWQTHRYPVNMDIQGDVDGDFAVQAGRSDTVNELAMCADDHETLGNAVPSTSSPPWAVAT